MSTPVDGTTPRRAGRARRVFLWLVLALVTLVLLLFAISNKQSTELRFWPFPIDVQAPLYLVSLILLIGGFALGHFVGWLGQARWRRDARRDARRVTALEQELAQLRPSETDLPPASALIAARPTR